MIAQVTEAEEQLIHRSRRIRGKTFANPWRQLCECYAKLIGVILQYWLLVRQGESQPAIATLDMFRRPHKSLASALQS
jgi:hypothetical protein